MKAAILVDSLIARGGVERIVLEQARILKADIFVGRFSRRSTFPEFKDFKITSLTSSPETGFKTIRDKLFTLSLWQNFSKLRLDYDLFIIHGSAALNAAKNHHPNIWYCHSPSRYLYDLYNEEYKKQSGLRKTLYPFVTSFLRLKDQNNVKNVDKILVNSVNVQGRVKKYYNRESAVLYPFVDTEYYRFIERGDFYLSSCRLDKIKRVHLSVKAFLEMPEKKLVVASDGAERQALLDMTKGAKNISFLGYVSEKELQDLYGKCIASLYLSYKEDFGIVPIESMAAGKPCIATNEGGFKETIVHKKTGYLVDNPEETNQVIEAVKWIEKHSKNMRPACEEQATLFSLSNFKKNFLKEIHSLIKE